MSNNQALSLLGGLTPTQFLAEYWQKKPLLIKNAIPDFTGLLSPDELAGLACEDEVQSRIVEYKKGKWSAKHGPFDDSDFAMLPERPTKEHNWTLLVQSVNHYLPEATALLQQFDFIPHARLDDLMVSYAPDGGGVGPHFDSYDVFLLQGQGKRLWRISQQTDLTLVEDAPLRILKSFDTSQEWLLEAGDMLYLPPHLAHWGIAVSEGATDCMTYSIGFRAPKNQELATEFLGFMQDRLNQDKLVLEGIYQDADLTLQIHPAEIDSKMISKVSANLQKIKWSDDVVAEFLGTYLSDPKADVVFDAHKKIALPTFSEKLIKLGIALDLKSQMLFFGDNFFINGEGVKFTGEAAIILQSLADKRCILAADFTAHIIQDAQLIQQLYDWYMAGYLNFNY
ncbi:cupin domain-containing protein [Methylotenera sp.]|uniref:cupin domain-containing protein n=1 Tax=Methylotenera sp. TaxID=2051956 RepID=UPI0027263A0F|nr:cupin domain-containing protein [Methylotenera sp.]MDO9205251.1 cupin domain-containing protein [Methylotenera sp.]MDP1521755.1 cupin domain-containing protein [Methylotenera sp.]MDP3306950.1 cupin domain-containing protein [Methylotenera sp.]MDP3817600.1 cupin domain-containing protein [Methylotenera sp.]